MDIVIYVVSGIFVLMAFGLLSAFFATKNLGCLFGALSYGAGGAYAFVTLQWWPLLVGFVAAWVVKLLLGDPAAN